MIIVSSGSLRPPSESLCNRSARQLRLTNYFSDFNAAKGELAKQGTESIWNVVLTTLNEDRSTLKMPRDFSFSQKVWLVYFSVNFNSRGRARGSFVRYFCVGILTLDLSESFIFLKNGVFLDPQIKC